VSVRSAAKYRMLEPRFPGACLHLLPEELLQLLYVYIGALPFFRHHYASHIYYLRTPPPPHPPPRRRRERDCFVYHTDLPIMHIPLQIGKTTTAEALLKRRV
jgi:hypothetical protein